MRETFNIGNRVNVNGAFATIRYIGELSEHQGTWYGVEWDEAAKGKHRGTYNNVCYFSVPDGKTGSFVRERHLKRGLSFLEAVEKRYQKIGTVDDTPDILNIVEMGGKDVQLITRSKDGRSAKSKTVAWNLVQFDIDLTGTDFQYASLDPSFLRATFPVVTHLNIGETLMEDLTDIFVILKGLPRLQCVTISNNVYRNPSDLKANVTFPSIRSVYCDTVNLAFSNFVEFCSNFPNLQKCSFALNGISSLEIPGQDAFTKLTEMHIQGNNLTDWKEINKLGRLPKLNLLNLYKNKLGSIQLKKEDQLFETLDTLILADNCMKSWTDLCDISNMQNLKHVVIRDNPVCDINPDRFREEVICRCPSLKTMNRSEILADERTSAKILYVKMYHSDWLAAGGSKGAADALSCGVSEEFQKLHPTYAKLFHEHGDFEQFVEKKQNISNQLLPLVIKTRDGTGVEKTVKEAKLLGSMSVSKVKMLIARMTRLNANQFTLSYRSDKSPDIEYPIDSDLKDLKSYAIEAGDTLLVLH